MNSQDYWAKRSAQQMWDYMDDAEAVAKELTDLYIEACNEIQDAAKKIFETYKSKYGLTQEEAERLLKMMSDPTDLRAVLRKLEEDPKNADLIKQIEGQAYGSRLARLSSLYSQIDNILSLLYAEQQNRTKTLLEELARQSYYDTIFNLHQYSGYGFEFKTLSRKQIEKVLKSRWYGQNYSQKIWSNREKLAKQVKKEIIKNLLTGRPLRDAAKSIEERFAVGYGSARRLIRTESCYTCNQLQLQAMKEHGIERYIYIAILDLRTSAICRSLDKEVFAIKDAVPGKNLPPMHPWCRSTIIAYVPKELLAKMKQSAIDPVTGQRIKVPGDMTHAEWYEKFVKGKEIAKTPKIASAESQYRDYLKLLHKNKVTLRKRQQKIYDAVKERGSWAEFRNKQVDIKDLAALTAYTGDEFALFSSENGKIVVHGGSKTWNLPEELWKIIKENKYEWTAHSHPTFRNIRCSPEDIETLKLFTWQTESVIIDLTGKTLRFTASERDWFDQVLGVK